MSRQTYNHTGFHRLPQSASPASPASWLQIECEIDGQHLQFRRSCSRPRAAGSAYFRCFATSLVISNMFTVDLPPKTPFSAVSALIIRLFFGSCSLFFLM